MRGVLIKMVSSYEDAKIKFSFRLRRLALANASRHGLLRLECFRRGN